MTTRAPAASATSAARAAARARRSSAAAASAGRYTSASSSVWRAGPALGAHDALSAVHAASPARPSSAARTGQVRGSTGPGTTSTVRPRTAHAPIAAASRAGGKNPPLRNASTAGPASSTAVSAVTAPRRIGGIA